MARTSQHITPVFICRHHIRQCYRCGLLVKDGTVATDIVGDSADQSLAASEYRADTIGHLNRARSAKGCPTLAEGQPQVWRSVGPPPPHRVPLGSLRPADGHRALSTGAPGDIWAHAVCRPCCSQPKCTRPAQCLDNEMRPWCRSHIKCTYPSIIKPSGVCGRKARIRIALHESQSRGVHVCCDAHDKATSTSRGLLCIATKMIKGETTRCSLLASPASSTDGLCAYHRNKQERQVKTLCTAFDKINIESTRDVLSALPSEVLTVIFSYCDSATLHKLYLQNRRLRNEIQTYDQHMVGRHCTVSLKPIPLRHYDDSMRGQMVVVTVAANGLWCIHDGTVQAARHRRRPPLPITRRIPQRLLMMPTDSESDSDSDDDHST